MISNEIKMMDNITDESPEVFADSLMDIIIVSSLQFESFHLSFYLIL